jgi:hypothetical protein
MSALGSLADIGLEISDVRFTLKSGMLSTGIDVRFVPLADIALRLPKLPVRGRIALLGSDMGVSLYAGARKGYSAALAAL